MISTLWNSNGIGNTIVAASNGPHAVPINMRNTDTLASLLGKASVPPNANTQNRMKMAKLTHQQYSISYKTVRSGTVFQSMYKRKGKK